MRTRTRKETKHNSQTSRYLYNGGLIYLKEPVSLIGKCSVSHPNQKGEKQVQRFCSIVTSEVNNSVLKSTYILPTLQDTLHHGLFQAHHKPIQGGRASQGRSLARDNQAYWLTLFERPVF